MSRAAALPLRSLSLYAPSLPGRGGGGQPALPGSAPYSGWVWRFLHLWPQGDPVTLATPSLLVEQSRLPCEEVCLESQGTGGGGGADMPELGEAGGGVTPFDR